MEGRGEMAFLAGWTTKVGSAAFCVRPFHIAIFLLCFVSDFFTSFTTTGISVWLAWVTSNFLLHPRKDAFKNPCFSRGRMVVGGAERRLSIIRLRGFFFIFWIW